MELPGWLRRPEEELELKPARSYVGRLLDEKSPLGRASTNLLDRVRRFPDRAGFRDDNPTRCPDVLFVGREV